MSFKIEGKVALVTGGSSGIGLAIAEQLLRNGAKGVAIIGLNQTNGKKVAEELTRKCGKNNCIFVQCDVSQQKQLEEAFETTVKTFKQLDIVINNAGMLNEQEWRKCVEVNMIGCIGGTKLAIEKYLPKYKSGNEAVILNTSSVVGLEPYYDDPVFVATKSGIVGLGRAFGAKENYEKTKVKVLTLCPGLTLTRLMEGAPPEFTSVAQTPQHVGESVVGIIQNGKSGSVWIVNHGKPAYEEQFAVKNYIFN